jgi:hypothetical protein
MKQSLSLPKQEPKSEMKASHVKERKFLNMTSGQPQPEFKPSQTIFAQSQVGLKEIVSELKLDKNSTGIM